MQLATHFVSPAQTCRTGRIRAQPQALIKTLPQGRDFACRAFSVIRNVTRGRATVPCVAASTTFLQPFKSRSRSAADTVRSLYTAVNARDLEKAMTFFAADCVYEDMIYAKPFEGTDAIRAQFGNIFRKVPADLAFVIDEVSDGTNGVGVTWHVELNGIPFPFGRGCSFIKLGPTGLITYVRDIPEPSSKPGDSTLWILNALSALIRKNPSIASAVTGAAAPAAAKRKGKAEAPGGDSEPPQLPPLPGWAAPAAWAFYAVYMYALFLSPDLPGDPGITPSAQTLEDVVNLSIDFFYVSPVLNNLGIHLTPAPEVHPAALAVFNVVNAWSIMFLGLIARDPRGAISALVLPPPAVALTRGKGVSQAQNLWLGQVFLTNVFFIPYLALRAGAKTDAAGAEEGALIKAAKDSGAMGIGAIFIFLVSVGWFGFYGGEEAYGGIADRIEYTANLFATDRVWVAFLFDCVLYSAFQAALIGDERAALVESGFEEGELPPAWLGLVPYGGLGAWLALRPQWEEVEERRRKKSDK